MVTLEEMKQYLRVDFEEDDKLIAYMLQSARNICMDVLRIHDESMVSDASSFKIAMMYSVAYLYEHRENADHHALTLTLRSLLFGGRQEGF